MNKMDSPVIPNVFATSKKKFMERFNKVVRLSKKIQIDFMDGCFVKSNSLGVQEIPSLFKYGKAFEAHLMVKRPLPYISKLKKKGFAKVIFHIESIKNQEEAWSAINSIKKMRMTPCIALNPKTPLTKITIYLKKVRHIMFMGINPGKEGQKLDPEVLKKIRALRRIDPKVKIQVDGGVNDKTAAKLARAGCNYLNTGSFVGDAKYPKKAKKILENQFEKGIK